MENKKLKGAPISVAELNIALYGTADPDMPRISPEDYSKLWESAKPKLSNPPIGKIIIGSTTGENNFYKNLWDKSEENGK